MAFNRRLDSIFPGMGVGLRNDSQLLQVGLAMSGTAQQTFPIPGSGTLSPTFTAGRLRIKIYNGGGTAPALADLLVQATDGTNTIVLGGGILHPNTAITLLASGNQWLEFEFEFVLDVATSGAGGGASGQLSSVIGGANKINVLTTMTGTAPTASLDLDLVPLI